MNVFLTNKYSSEGLIDFKNVDPANKVDSSYYLACATSFYNDYLRGGSFMSPATHKLYDENYLYATGGIDVDSIRPQLVRAQKYPENRATSNAAKLFDDISAAAWDNLDWSPVSPMPHVMKQVAKVEDIFVADVRVYPIDPTSKAKEEDDKANAFVRMKNFEFIKEYSRRAGIPIDDSQFIPDSPEQLNLYAQSGGFKAAYARAFEVLLKWIETDSGYDEIAKNIRFDLCTYGVAGARCEFDEMSGRMLYRWKSPKTSFIQHSKYNDFRDSNYAGDFETINISDLAVYGFDVNQRSSIAQSLCGVYDNPPLTEWNDYNVVNSMGFYRWDNFKCCIMNIEWIDVDTDYRKEYTTPFGEKRYAGEKWGTKLGVKTNKRVFTVSKLVLRECSLVVGTDFVFNFGIASNVPRSNGRDVSLTYKFYRLDETPIVVQLKPLVDAIFMAWMRWQNDVATAWPDFWTVNLHMLNNVKVGKEAVTAPDLIKMAKTGRILPYMQSMIGTYEGGDVQPVRKVQGDVVERVQSRAAEIDNLFMKIYQIIGINAGINQNAIETAAEVKSLYASNNEILTSIAKSLNKIKLNIAKVVVQRINTAMMIPSYLKDTYGHILSDYQIEVLNDARSFVNYGLDMVLRPSDKEKADIVNAANIALQGGLITLDTHMYVIEMINNNVNLSWIRIYIGYMIKQNEQKKYEQQQALIKQQSEGNMQYEQSKQQTLGLESQLKGQLLQGEIQLKNQGKLQAAELAGDIETKMRILTLLSNQETSEQDRMLLSRELDMINQKLHAV